jgi:hypothetical protein
MNSITGMVNALSKKYPDKYVNIKHVYGKHAHLPKIRIDYDIYIEDVLHEVGESWQELKDLVAEHLK